MVKWFNVNKGRSDRGIDERVDEKPMKKIVVFSNMYPSQKHPTFGIFVKNQVELLRSTGLEVDVVAIDEPGKGKVEKVKKYGSWFMRSFLYMMKGRRNLALTHAHYAFPTGLLSLIGKKLMGIPYVVTVHGGDIDKMAAKSRRIADMTKRILQHAEAVIVVGEKLKSDVIGRFGVAEKAVHVLSMGVDTAVFKPVRKDEVRKAIGLSIEGKIILFVGNVIKAKGLLELVEAFDLLKKTEQDVSLFIVGSQKDSNFVEELQTFIRDKGVKDIHFKEPLGQADLAMWMAASDVLTLPSYHEGFGLVALEAMAAGTKVVATDVGGLSYLLNNGAGILVELKNAGSLAKGLEDALDSNALRIDENAMREKVDAHSYEVILQNLLSIYHEARKGRKS